MSVSEERRGRPWQSAPPLPPSVTTRNHSPSDPSGDSRRVVVAKGCRRRSLLPPARHHWQATKIEIRKTAPRWRLLAMDSPYERFHQPRLLQAPRPQPRPQQPHRRPRPPAAS